MAAQWLSFMIRGFTPCDVLKFILGYHDWSIEDLFWISKFPDMQVLRENAAWLQFTGKWGSTVEAPQKQEWYIRAENPVSRTWLQQVKFLPLSHSHLSDFCFFCNIMCFPTALSHIIFYCLHCMLSIGSHCLVLTMIDHTLESLWMRFSFCAMTYLNYV